MNEKDVQKCNEALDLSLDMLKEQIARNEKLRKEHKGIDIERETYLLKEKELLIKNVLAKAFIARLEYKTKKLVTGGQK